MNRTQTTLLAAIVLLSLLKTPVAGHSLLSGGGLGYLLGTLVGSVLIGGILVGLVATAWWMVKRRPLPGWRTALLCVALAVVLLGMAGEWAARPPAGVNPMEKGISMNLP